MMIAFFGPDGTGKSTVADKLEKKLNSLDINTYRYHWRPRFLPSLSKNDNMHFDVTRPDDLKPRSWLISCLIYIYFFCDFLLAYFMLFMHLKRKGAIIIYERYFYDILFHPTRYRLKSINRLSLILVKLLPSPNINILLKGKPEIIYSRKPELPIKEIKNQLTKMEHNLPLLGETLIINATQNDPLTIMEQIYDYIYIST